MAAVLTEAEIIERQALYIAAYAKSGTKSAAARADNVARDTADRWINDNINGFRDALQGGRSEHNDSLEDKLFDLCMGMKPGQNCTALIFALNGALPEKYRPGVHIASTQAAELLKKLEALGGRGAVDKAAKAAIPEDDLTPQQQVEAILRAAQRGGTE